MRYNTPWKRRPACSRLGRQRFLGFHPSSPTHRPTILFYCQLTNFTSSRARRHTLILFFVAEPLGTMPATFLDLPPELQLLINDFILPTDLRTHVCFFLSDPRCISFYSSRPDSERFWSVLCWNDGLGQLADGMETQATWCDIAVSVISRDGFCTHPQCGEALLDHNRMCTPL